MKMRRGMSIGELLMWVAAIAVIGFVAYKYLVVKDEDAARRQESAEEAQLPTEESSEEKARRLRDEDRLRKLREEAAERKRKAEEEASSRSAYRDSLGKFANAEAAVWADRKGERPEFETVKETMLVVFPDFKRTQTVYEVSPRADGEEVVVLRKPTGVATPIAAEKFGALIKESPSATLCDGRVWLRGVPKNGSAYEVPRRGRDFMSADVELGELYAALASLDVKFEEMKSRLILRPQNGGEQVVMGILSYDDSLRWEKLEDFARQSIEERNKKLSVGKKPPKLKRFKQTVVLYDGQHVKKTVKGVTLVPRTFNHLGTSRSDLRWSYQRNWEGKKYSTVNDFYRKWSDLYSEALRQEREAKRVAQENERAVAEFEREQAMRNSARVSLSEIEKELSKWRIVVDRGRIKGRAKTAAN